MIRWVTAFLDRPSDGFDATRDFWLAATGTVLSSSRGEREEFATLVPTTGDACLRLQRTLDGGAGSHLDLHVDDVSETTDRAAGLGASVVTEMTTLTSMSSPGGLAFCVVAHRGEEARPLPVGAVGRRTLVDQVSIDIASDRFDEECRFWADLTGWSLRPGAEPDFAVLGRADGQPFRFLLQRRGADDVGLPTSCHLDLACDDIATSVDAHTKLGASVVARFPWWTVMIDPAGIEYCLTRRDPDTGVHG